MEEDMNSTSNTVAVSLQAFEEEDRAPLPRVTHSRISYSAKSSHLSFPALPSDLQIFDYGYTGLNGNRLQQFIGCQPGAFQTWQVWTLSEQLQSCVGHEDVWRALPN